MSATPGDHSAGPGEPRKMPQWPFGVCQTCSDTIDTRTEHICRNAPSAATPREPETPQTEAADAKLMEAVEMEPLYPGAAEERELRVRASSVHVTPVDPNRLWRAAEDTAVCTCGLLAVGYRASWAISHSEGCPVSEVYRMLVLDAAQKAARP